MEIQIESVGKDSGQVAALWADRARIAERKGDLQRASQCLTVAMRIFSKTNPAIYGQNLWHTANWMSSLALQVDDAALYREACRELVKSYASFHDRRDPVRADRTAWVSVVLPDTFGDPTPVIKIAEDAFAAHPQNYWLCRSWAAALYRAGRIDESLRYFDHALEIKGDDGEISTWLFLAMVHSKAGHRVEAQQWLAKARPWLEARMPELRTKAGTSAPAANNREDRAVESSLPSETTSIGVQPLSRDESAAFKRLLLEAEAELSKAGS
jgi:tetratricopeptide (TPR) repeat protein